MSSFDEKGSDDRREPVEPSTPGSPPPAGENAAKPSLPPEDWIYDEARGEEGESDEPVREGANPSMRGPYRSRLVEGAPSGVPNLTKVDTSKAEWRLLILDTWQR